MPRRLKKLSLRAGLAPGTLVYVGERRVEKTAIAVIDYNEAEMHEATGVAPEDCQGYVNAETVTWIDLVGLHDTDVLQALGNVSGIHPLILEDIVNTGQRPKMEDHGEYIYMVLKMLYRRPNDDEIVAEQVSLILGKGYVLSFQEVPGDVFGPVRERIQKGKGRIRRMGADYLAYSLLDAIVDNYFLVLEDIGEKIEALQERVIDHADPETLQGIHRLKRDMIFMRKSLWPLRELAGGVERSESPLIQETTGPYLRDIYEHTIQVIDTVESLRDMLSGALEIYMTTVSNRMNEVMKVLTVIATIFIPLTFIAGVYGMNFENMPELKWPFGYAAVLGVMVAMGVGMVVFFKRRKWL